ncbi:hypothetical protein R1flu_002805 [Riccia fluitans]|uniref:Kinesin motor domain-containing protein n=1 Tax=Riccia fluitans TaxID=41844 RepID=A0ABD1Y7C2_9MARC
MEKISVAIRVRPPTKSEPQSAKGFKWRVGQHSVALYSLQGTPINGQSFAFDHVYGTETKNADIYRGLTKEVIMSTLSGFNGTVFAYGQTSSGKTYTMKGTAEDPGIIRLSVHDVFNKIQEISNREFLIRVSYMEIYNEEINDLFAPENRRLQIHENLEKGIFVAGLREEIVDSPDQVFQLLEFGESHRHFGETNMNLYSSRSHTIFRMVIESRDVTLDGIDIDGNSDAVRVSALNLVDLAGSERIAKTGAGGVRLKEGTHINKSLMTLGTVINKLSDGSGRHGGHIPYRDSKLTRILQPALGGNARTAMICTVTPDEIHIDETRGTLQFASRAKRVTNCAQVNEILTDAALLKRQTREIEDLRMKLQGLPQSEHLEKEILNLRNELLKYELEKERLFLELQEEKKAQVVRERRIKEQELKIENLSTLFMSSTVDDRDSGKQLRKVNRRETWCPRQFNSHNSTEDFDWKGVAKDETMDILYTMRRDRRGDLPPAFETFVDEEAWNDSSVLDEPPPDFENIADEDTWMSLNKGHTTSSIVLTSNVFERSRSSGGSSYAEKLAAMETDLKNLQVKYGDLQSNHDAKILEATKELRSEVDHTKSELERMLNANARFQTELENTLKENAALRHALSAQLESERHLRRVIDAVECEMDAARLLTSSLQGLLVDSLRAQALTVQNIHGCFPLSKELPYKSPGARERKAMMETSAQKCRDICADVDGAVHDILAKVQVRTEDNLDYRQYDTEGKSKEVKFTKSSRDPASTGPRLSLSSESDSLYCRVCLSSPLPWVKLPGNEKFLLSKVCHVTTCQCDVIAETHSRLMTLVRQSECDIDHLFQTGDGSKTHGKSMAEFFPKVSSSVPSEARTKDDDVTRGSEGDPLRASYAVPPSGESESGGRDRTGWTVSPSGSQCKYSREELGRTSGTCRSHEIAVTSENPIAVAMGNLCGEIFNLLKPPSVQDDKPTTRSVHGATDFQDVNLQARLASAKVLTAWLFEELHTILKHDLNCLKSHVKERSSFGLMLESLQVLLLENASLAVVLMQATCQDERVMKQFISRLQALKELYNTPLSLVPEMTTADVVNEMPDQTDMPIHIVQLAAPENQAFATISRLVEPAETSYTPVPGRVLKLKGVEEMRGKLLQYFMGRLLNRENQVVNGITLLLTLTVVVQPPSIHPQEPQQLEMSVVRIEDALTGLVLDQVSVSGEANNSGPHQSVRTRNGSSRDVAPGITPTETSAPEGDWTGAKVVQLNSGESERCKRPLDGDILDDLCKAKNVKEFICRISESNKKLRKQLDEKGERIIQLEYRLASSEMASVELKLELQNLHARLQICEVTSQKGVDFDFESELEALKIRCEHYEEEIRLIMEQVPTPDDELRRERQLAEVMEENLSLRDRLIKANQRLAENRRRRSSKSQCPHAAVRMTKREDTTTACCDGGVTPGTIRRGDHDCKPDVDDSRNLTETYAEESRQQVNLEMDADDAKSQFHADGSKEEPDCPVPRLARLALGELEVNANNRAVPGNSKRSRQKTTDDYVFNKENLAMYR